ncbi:MAG: hypothetical protein NT069_27285, partial [Planctomycetota bacterium]|nr:hypothetical protein [Planctomycetota bacterium]
MRGSPAGASPANPRQPPRRFSPSRPPPAELTAPDFYTKFINAHGYPIVASTQVDDYALREAAYLVDLMLAHRPDVRDAMIASGSRLCVIGHKEFTTDLPEFAKLGPVAGFDGISAKDFWDARARGTGGSQSDPYCSCGEENLLSYDGDPYSTECILIHEFAHNLHLRGLVRIDPTFDGRVRAAYDKAMSDGLWKGKYASVNHHEYFAEGVQSWFDNNRENDHDHNHVNTRAELVEYDPRLAELCKEVFGDTELKYTKPVTRLTGHMAGYDPAKAPKFAWPARLAAAQASIRQQAEARNRKAERKPEPPTETATKPQQPPANPWLTLDRILKNGEFGERGPKGLVWSRRSPSNFTFESPKQGDKGRDLVRNDNVTATQEVVVPGAAFVPTGSNNAPSIASF